MTLTALLQSQLTDVFRIGLIVALVITMHRTEAVTGRIVPLLAGIVFIAVIIPITMPATEPLPRSIGMGLVANAILLGGALAVMQLVRRIRK